MDLHRAAALGLAPAGDHDADLAVLLLALLVPQGLEPDEQVDLATGEPHVHVAEVPLVDEREVLLPLVRLADVRGDRVAGRPALGEPGEHRVAVGEVGVDRADELALLAERQRPDVAHEHLARVVLAQQHVPHRPGEVLPELRLGELPRDGVHAVLDEHLPEGLRLGLQATAEQLDLLLDGDLEAHWMISASQVFLTRSIRLRSSGVISTDSSAPGMSRATFCTAPSTTIECGSNSCGSSW